MFGNIYITPAIDILLFVLVAYAIVYTIYIFVYKKDARALLSVDLKVSVVMLLLVSAYYYGTGIHISFVGLQVHWLLYYLILSGAIEFIFFFIYKHVVGVSWSEIIDIDKIS